ncbi:HNH endonuclease [Fictibacillus gelatini]|uniref:HNH endonuclease n=1 Tax=Fictibacillus gelatini TaxID=225985 RepID=UPI0009D6CC3B|nr:HNH endonuclease [Fictibacillus gelatini]
MNLRHACPLYKKCKICEQIKYYSEFPPRTGRKRSSGARKSYCKVCEPRKHEKILPAIPCNYSFDISLLSYGDIKVKEKKKNGRFFEYYVPVQIATQLVTEEAAGIVHEGLIHKLYNKEEFRHLIIERSSYTCFYCGKYGDTIDHLTPKSKGGLTTPKNCVCACKRCNQLKNDDDVKYLV